jgi:hypothetical protein
MTARVRLALVRTVLALGAWYAVYRVALKFLGERHAVVYLLLFVLFPLVVLLGVWLVRAIMASVLNPDV